MNDSNHDVLLRCEDGKRLLMDTSPIRFSTNMYDDDIRDKMNEPGKFKTILMYCAADDQSVKASEIQK